MTGNDESGTGSSTLAVAGGRPITPFLSNDEATSFLRLSPRTPDKYRGIGGGPPFLQIGEARLLQARRSRGLGRAQALRFYVRSGMAGERTLVQL